ncbi:DUF1735 domain-containing protein [Fulvivirga maritima]|uniref:BT_3987 domain-containing protein n=1 Tax=Fulvivirga maritima TaxID=2904247 RepID=UPI001F1DA1AD|nr:DUF1735 domain-containing protein [Fulvivirga maritima]UII27679.1 DUF1735 domain-containing protein [Fulvivirga maritima]
MRKTDVVIDFKPRTSKNMKNNLNIKIAAFFLLAIGFLMLQACDDDESFDVEGESTTRVYLNSGSYTVGEYMSFPFSIIHTPLGSIGSVQASFPIRSTMPSESPITVSIQADNSLVDAYNEVNETEYSALPDGVAQLVQNTLTIPSGATISADSMTVSIPVEAYVQLTEANYILPLTLSSVQSGDATISENRNTLYLMVNTEVTNLYNNVEESDVEGVAVDDRSLWTASLDIPIGYGTMSNMFNGSAQSYWYVTPPQEATITIDLGQEYSNISELSLHTYSRNYSLTSVTVSSGVEEGNWESIGTADLSTSSSLQYIKFYEPIDARFLRIHVNGWIGDYLVISEFNIYTSN